MIPVDEFEQEAMPTAPVRKLSGGLVAFEFEESGKRVELKVLSTIRAFRQIAKQLADVATSEGREATHDEYLNAVAQYLQAVTGVEIDADEADALNDELAAAHLEKKERSAARLKSLSSTA